MNSQEAVRGGWELAPRTKTGKVAVYTLPAEVMEVLQAHRVHQLKEQRDAGSDWGSNAGLVFTTMAGTPIDQNNFRKQWYRHLERAGLPRTKPYTMRHSALTTLAADGVDLPTLAALARHARPSTTANVYLHNVPDSVTTALTRRKLPV